MSYNISIWYGNTYQPSTVHRNTPTPKERINSLPKVLPTAHHIAKPPAQPSKGHTLQ